MADFIPGLKLSELYFHGAVRPILSRRFASLRYSAGLIDTGSDVLGFDTPMSRDHGWGPRCMLLLGDDDRDELARQIDHALAHELPFEFLGYPTHFVITDSPCMRPTTERPIRHWVKITTVGRFFREYLGVDPRGPLDSIDWLALPSQKLRTIRAGKVFHDGLGELEPCRRALAGYPHDLWLYLIACQWQRIGQEEPFVARAGDVGDEPGSRIIAARLIEDVMKLCFLIEREYPPYAKWFGTAFARLRCATELTPHFDRALDARNWRERESHLSQAYLILQRLNNALALTAPLPEQIGQFHNRPYRVPHSGRYVEALRRAIRSAEVRALPPHVGAVWQFSNATDVLEDVAHCRSLTSLYRAPCNDGTSEG